MSPPESADPPAPNVQLPDPARLWIPAYALGDLSIHSRYSPHFTTGFGTATAVTGGFGFAVAGEIVRRIATGS